MQDGCRLHLHILEAHVPVRPGLWSQRPRLMARLGDVEKHTEWPDFFGGKVDVHIKKLALA